jgi:hypothetical protein
MRLRYITLGVSRVTVRATDVGDVTPEYHCGMRSRVCDCEKPEFHGLVAPDGSTTATICAVCNRPGRERRRHPQGVLEAAVDADLNPVLLPSEAVSTVIVNGELLYSVHLSTVRAALLETLDAQVVSDGGEQDERVMLPKGWG